MRWEENRVILTCSCEQESRNGSSSLSRPTMSPTSSVHLTNLHRRSCVKNRNSSAQPQRRKSRRNTVTGRRERGGQVAAAWPLGLSGSLTRARTSKNTASTSEGSRDGGGSRRSGHRTSCSTCHGRISSTQLPPLAPVLLTITSRIRRAARPASAREWRSFPRLQSGRAPGQRERAD
jgi:hypothetical protein